MAEKLLSLINMDLLPIKAHYFFLYGAMGGVMPFMPVLGKGLGISATGVGVTYTVVPIFIFLSKPLFGYLTDHFRNIKAIMSILILIVAVTFFFVLFIPEIPSKIQLECSESDRTVNTSVTYDKDCFVKNVEMGQNFEFNDGLCNSSRCVQNCIITKANFTAVSSDGDDLSDIFIKQTVSNNVKFADGKLILLEIETESGLSSICDCIHEHPSSFSFKKPLFDPCTLESESSQSSYANSQFWIFTLFAVISGTGSATSFCLSDAACYEVLGDQPDLYGRQRLWATISWGIVTLVTGYFNDLATSNSYHEDYSPGFYLMAALVAVDLIILFKIKLTKANVSSNICKDVGKIFVSNEMVAFAVGVFITGALTGLLWNYQFWYLQDLGATQTLLGLTVAIQCLAAEVPFFFFAGWIIKKIGHYHCLSASFAAYALRYGLYYFLTNPWFTLPIEVLHGVTFALFYAAMTSYASENAPAGTEATTLGVLGGLFEGLGVAIGSFLGGIGFDSIGGANTFLTAAIISALCAPCFMVIHLMQRLTDYFINAASPF